MLSAMAQHPGDAGDADPATLVGTSEFRLSDRGLCLAVSVGGPFQTYELPENGELLLGRSSSCHVRIEDSSISRKHLLLRHRGEGHIAELHVKDLGSANGVRVSGARIDPDTWVRLSVGEVAQVGAAMVVVRPAQSAGRPRRIWPHGYFESRVEEECARSARSRAEFGVVRLSVPPTFTASAVEDVVAPLLRASDVLARYAPSQYEVLYLDMTSAEVETATRRLVEALSTRLSCAATTIAIGVAMYPGHGRAADRLLARANDAVRGTDTAESDRDALAGRTGYREQLPRIASSGISVLILGETGVGKEICAEQIHELSPRKDEVMLRLNCAALSETLLESELFGYEKGSFTGAMHSKPGLFESANGGTVFLDEVGELPASTQVKLLRVLDNREVQRIGALTPKAIDVRFIAATHRDLEAEVAAGRFRQDLLFRINTFSVLIPPLRSRRDEIEPLARHFLELACTEMGRNVAPAITAEALAALHLYPWPGNIRELRNVMQRAVVLCADDPIERKHLPVEKMEATIIPSVPALHPALPGTARPATDSELRITGRLSPATVESQPTPQDTLRDSIDEMKKRQVVEALEQCAGNQSKAAKLLGVSRGTLIKRLDRYNIARPRKKR